MSHMYNKNIIRVLAMVIISSLIFTLLFSLNEYPEQNSKKRLTTIDNQSIMIPDQLKDPRVFDEKEMKFLETEICNRPADYIPPDCKNMSRTDFFMDIYKKKLQLEMAFYNAKTPFDRIIAASALSRYMPPYYFTMNADLNIWINIVSDSSISYNIRKSFLLSVASSEDERLVPWLVQYANTQSNINFQTCLLYAADNINDKLTTGLVSETNSKVMGTSLYSAKEAISKFIPILVQTEK